MDNIGLHWTETFRGVKLHAAVNQHGLPLRAVVTPDNCYDEPVLPKLVEDIEVDYVLADAGCCSKRNRQVVKDMGVVAFIADNPRKKGKNCKIERLCPSEKRAVCC
jgi:transposase